MPKLSEGEHRISLALPVILDPSQRYEDLYQPSEIVVMVDFIYDVFWDDSPVVTFCNTADHLLLDSSVFSPDALIRAGDGALSEDQLLRFEGAARVFEMIRSSGGGIDPGPFFDLVEETCDITYDERWHVFVN